ncbi:MAG TPA: YeeE/YedE family protein [Myxococcota bacterium]
MTTTNRPGHDHDPLEATVIDPPPATTTTQRLVAVFASALLFAAGLVVSGMTQPAKVAASLDVTGRWDASLMFVMVGAIGVHAAFLWVTRRNPRPLFDDRFHPSTLRAIDARLVVGAALFGVGWGIGGVCPGPGLITIFSGALPVIVFVAFMLVGFAAYAVWERVTTTATTAP